MWDVKYRPLVFDEVLGQEGHVEVLRSRLKEGKAFDTSYIFAGGHGCGKTTLARIMARAMLCLNPGPNGDPCNECDHCKGCLSETFDGFTEMDAASNGKTDDMRQLVEGLAYPLPGVPKRIYLLDEAHRMSRDGQDVLLKPIEDKRVVAVLCTTELHKIRDTIKSRCEVYEIRKTPREAILQRMKLVLDSEGVEHEDEAVLDVIDIAHGHVRDALNKLETVAQTGPVTRENVRDRLNLGVVSTFYEVMLSLGDPSKSVPLVEAACDRVGPADVASGLAEAAMNSYRQANNIHLDSYLDREKAQQVYDMYGDATVGLSEFFLRSATTTRLHLICDIVKLAQTGGQVPQVSEAPKAPPVVVQATTPVAAPAPTSAAEPPKEAPKLTLVSKEAESPAPSPPAVPKPEPTQVPQGKDPYALHPNDGAAVPADKPRGATRERVTKRVKKAGSSSEARGLSPNEFRVQLLSLLDRR